MVPQKKGGFEDAVLLVVTDIRREYFESVVLWAEANPHYDMSIRSQVPVNMTTFAAVDAVFFGVIISSHPLVLSCRFSCDRCTQVQHGMHHHPERHSHGSLPGRDGAAVRAGGSQRRGAG